MSKLRELIAAASAPPPWFAVPNNLIGGYSISTLNCPVGEEPNGSSHCPADFCAKADAALIVALVNHAEAIAELIEAARTYYTNYAQDEAEEDTGFTAMHNDAKALRDALAKVRDL